MLGLLDVFGFLRDLRKSSIYCTIVCDNFILLLSIFLVFRHFGCEVCFFIMGVLVSASKELVEIRLFVLIITIDPVCWQGGLDGFVVLRKFINSKISVLKLDVKSVILLGLFN